MPMGVPEYDVIVVGAGFGGMGAAIQLKKMGYDNILIVDREDDLGGTWHVNHYPGLAVDVPTTTYSYFFEPNPNWSRLFSTGTEIKQYADDVADKYDIRRHIRYNTTVEGARWDEDARLWQINIAGAEPLSARTSTSIPETWMSLLEATGAIPRSPPTCAHTATPSTHSAATTSTRMAERRRAGWRGMVWLMGKTGRLLPKGFWKSKRESVRRVR